jgi:hypothetical protein
MDASSSTSLKGYPAPMSAGLTSPVMVGRSEQLAALRQIFHRVCAGSPAVSIEAAESGLRARATTRIDRYAFGLTAAKGMAARYLDIDLTAAVEPL